MDTLTIQFLHPYTRWQPGDVATLPLGVADALCRRRRAVVVQEESPEAAQTVAVDGDAPRSPRRKRKG